MLVLTGFCSILQGCWCRACKGCLQREPAHVLGWESFHDASWWKWQLHILRACCMGVHIPCLYSNPGMLAPCCQKDRICTPLQSPSLLSWWTCLTSPQTILSQHIFKHTAAIEGGIYFPVLLLPGVERTGHERCYGQAMEMITEIAGFRFAMEWLWMMHLQLYPAESL